MSDYDLKLDGMFEKEEHERTDECLKRNPTKTKSDYLKYHPEINVNKKEYCNVHFTSQNVFM